MLRDILDERVNVVTADLLMSLYIYVTNPSADMVFD